MAEFNSVVRPQLIVDFLTEHRKELFIITSKLSKDKRNLYDFDLLCEQILKDRGNTQFFIFLSDYFFQEFDVGIINNIHVGEVYSASQGCGGPYIGFYMFKENANSDGQITISLKPSFWLGGENFIKTPESIKVFYNLMKKTFRQKKPKQQ